MNTDIDIILENERVKLEPLDLSKLDVLNPISTSHPDLLKYSPSAFGTEEKLKEYVKKALRDRWKSERYPFVIYDKQSQRYVGSTSFGNISPSNKRIEIGWTWLDPEVQGTGINQACKKLLLDYAFDELECERVEFKTDALNAQSRKALEKIGAKFEGLLRSHTVLANGRRRDTVYYSILREEWVK
ncbi:GNAT family N-acetyltransferase [Portibacter marinus]|uniref:GNAT family N-acetyltransferase n=1 Tax=Portibacter marinus TaxID=2898660 RepID=UPI001F39135F|nr:GNAT family protein [Portibacter marinus]